MTRHWVTIASPTTEAMVNPLLAACEQGYTPDVITVLSNPSVADDVDEVVPLYRQIHEAYGTEGDISTHTVTSETAFDEIAEFYRQVTDVPDGDTVAVDITPGRKFMSSIAFQGGIYHGADHVFYLHVGSNRHYGRLYPNVPKTGVDLIDFTEVV